MPEKTLNKNGLCRNTVIAAYFQHWTKPVWLSWRVQRKNDKIETGNRVWVVMILLTRVINKGFIVSCHEKCKCMTITCKYTLPYLTDNDNRMAILPTVSTCISNLLCGTLQYVRKLNPIIPDGSL